MANSIVARSVSARSATPGTYPDLVPGRVVRRLHTLAAVLLVLPMLLVNQLLVERQSLMVQRVTETVALRAQVGLVVGVRDGLDRDLVGDREAVALEAEDLLRVVGEDPDAGE